MQHKKLTQNSAFGAAILVFFFFYTLAVRFIDVDSIGVKNSDIGFSTVNSFFRDMLPLNKLWYSVSKYFGYIVLLTAVMFAVLTLIQFIRRKNIAKMDRNYISLMLFYCVIVLLYVFFELVSINYRPVILDEGPEPSYPSTHTMLAITIMGSASIQFNRLFKDKNHRSIAKAAAAAIAFIVVIGRILSGVHWASDILGGIILSSGLLIVYNSVYIRLENTEKRLRRKNKKASH